MWLIDRKSVVFNDPSPSGFHQQLAMWGAVNAMLASVMEENLGAYTESRGVYSMCE
jgi:hypothetical protein